MPDRSWTRSLRPAPRSATSSATCSAQTSPHNGTGHVALLRADERTAGSPLIDLIHFVVLPAGATTGHHRHHDDREPV
jgi:hypothetical protein